MNAWQKMARVLTHEIMNSITPISSLASTARGILAKVLPRNAGTDGKDVADALRSIERRSKSLLRFVENYRKLLRVPKPQQKTVRVRDVVSKVRSLLAGTLEQRRIRLSCSIVPPGLELAADPDLIEQVLINMIKNSVEALTKTRRPTIEVAARLDDHLRAVVEIADNGHGIPADLLDRVFVPFFTTKGEGSGIGLSLSRQIMRLHGGSISVTSVPNKRTVFSLRF